MGTGGAKITRLTTHPANLALRDSQHSSAPFSISGTVPPQSARFFTHGAGNILVLLLLQDPAVLVVPEGLACLPFHFF